MNQDDESMNNDMDQINESPKNMQNELDSNNIELIM